MHQHADVQAYLTLRVLRNALDGVDIDTGIGTPDDAGNCLTKDEDYRYSEEERSYYALNVAVTADNYKDFTDSTKIYDKVSNQLDSGKSAERKYGLTFTMHQITSLVQHISHYLKNTMIFLTLK